MVFTVCDGVYWWDVEILLEKCQNTIENVMDLMVIMGIALVLMETIMCLLVCDGFYWWDVNPIVKNAQNTIEM